MEETEVEHFVEGQGVEVSNTNKGFKGSWFPATVVGTPRRRKNKRSVRVEYETLMASEKSEEPLKEFHHPSRLRPKPPHKDVEKFEVDEQVDAYQNGGWWEGTIIQVMENQWYRVYFKDSDEEIEFQHCELRRHHEWVDGRWICPHELKKTVTTPSRGGQTESPVIGQKRTSVKRKRAQVQVLSEILDHSLDGYNKETPKPIRSCVDVPEHGVESSESRNHLPSEGCCSHLPLSTSALEQGEVLGVPKSQMQDINRQKIKGMMQIKNVFRRRKVSETQASVKGPSELKLLDPLEVVENPLVLDPKNVNMQMTATEDESLPVGHIPDERSLENEGLPFSKKSNVWKIVESHDVFRMMPQKPHFRPLEKCKVLLREGRAIGNMCSFATLVEKIEKTKIEDPANDLHDILEAFQELGADGFDVIPIQEQLGNLLKIKDEFKQLHVELHAAEEKTIIIRKENHQLGVELDQIGKEVRGVDKLVKKLKEMMESIEIERKIKTARVSELKTKLENIREEISISTHEFNGVATAPWQMSSRPTMFIN